METNKPTILILHGWGRFTNSWMPVKKQLEDSGCSVFYPSIPGLDEKQPLEKPWTIDNYVEWAKDFAEKNNLGKFFILGHSFGGRISIKFAVKYPEKLNGLILVSAAGIRNKKISKIYNLFVKLAKIINKLSFLPGYELCRKMLYRLVLRKTDYITLKTQIMKDTFKKVIEEDLSDRLTQIKIPTVILWGDKDKTTPLSDARFIREAIPNSKLEILPGIGHKPHIEVPELLAQKITEFINAN